MPLNAFLFFSVCSCIASVAGQVNLLTYVDGGIGDILGSSFGAPGTNASYDYVVVDSNLSVVVIEAGGFYELDDGNRSVVPGYATYYTGSDPNNYQPLIDWGFSTVPKPAAGNRTVHYARGKTLGGPSARNYMIYHRPTKGSLQKWADEVGDQSYTWDQFLPFYKKSCKFTSFDPGLYNATILPQPPGIFDPSGGPLHISFSNYADAFGSWAQKAFIAVGMALQNVGLNAGLLNGSAFSTLTIDPRNGYRSSSESSFLQAALQNGTAPMVYKNSLAERILFDGNTATGVLVSTAGSHGTKPVNFTLKAKKEVIVSAGAFQYPPLLMVSGIGPKATLQQYGIRVIKDLAGVGQNMWDHVLFSANRRVNVLTASASLNSVAVAAKGAALFRTNGSGPLAAFGAGYYRWEKLPSPYRKDLSNASLSSLATFPSDWPESKWLPVSAYLGYQTNRQEEDPRDGYNYATNNPGIIAPLSCGNVTISSASMAHPPVLDPAWLSDPTDQEMVIQSFKRSREIWGVLAHYGITNGDAECHPGLNVTSDKDILTFIQESLMTINHAAGTYSRARVLGVKNLRVVDASSFPFLPADHPQSTVYALLEKIAADILGPSVPLPGYNMAGYYADQRLILQHETKITNSTLPFPDDK